MKNYTGIIETKVYEVEDRLHRCKDNRIYIIEYGDKIARVCEVNSGFKKRDGAQAYNTIFG